MQITDFKKYAKINGLYKRDEKGKIILNDYSMPVFDYLKNNIWHATEKIDGTNIRICFYKENGKLKYMFGGRTDNSNIPKHLVAKLQTIVDSVKNWEIVFHRELQEGEQVIIFGEGYGNKIQAAGKGYLANDVNFIIFDCLFGSYWYSYQELKIMAAKCNLEVVPSIGYFTLEQAEKIVKEGFVSKIAENKTLMAEGLILRPNVEGYLSLYNERITVKIKQKDYK